MSGGGSIYAWNSPFVISFFIIGGISAALFVIVEWKVAKVPVMPSTFSICRFNLWLPYNRTYGNGKFNFLSRGLRKSS